MKIKSIGVFTISLLIIFIAGSSCKAQSQSVCKPINKNINELRTLVASFEAKRKIVDSGGLKTVNEALYCLYQALDTSLSEQISLNNEAQAIVASDTAVAELKRLKSEREAVGGKLKDLMQGLLASPNNPVSSAEAISNPPKEIVKSVAEPTPPLKEVKPVVSSANNLKDKSTSNAPPILIDEIQKIAKQVIFNVSKGRNKPVENAAAERFPTLFNLAVATGFETDTSSSPIYNLEPIRFLLETARTDKQIGASSSTAASTSAIDKPGFPSLLGFAIENGYIERDVQDTVLTLNTSPAALLSIGSQNTTEAYQNSEFFNRIGLSASFNINNQTALLSNVSKSQLREFSIRTRLYGDRSARSKEIQNIWEKESEAIRPLLRTINTANINIDNDAVLNSLRDSTGTEIVKRLEALVASDDFKALEKKKLGETDQNKKLVVEGEEIKLLTNAALDYLLTSVVEPLRNKSVQVSPEVQNQINNNFVQGLNTAQENQKIVFKAVKERLDKFFKQPLATAAYINHRAALGNFSEFKFIYEQPEVGFFKPFSNVTFNAGLSFYHKPNATMNQKKIRDFDFALSFEGKRASPFTETGDLSQITYSFTGRYTRMLENQDLINRKADLLKAQFLLTFPIFRGAILPFSVTYSNATEFERKQGVQVNFGLKLDTDKLFEINRFKRLLQ